MNQAKNLRRVRREDYPIVERRTDALDRGLELWTLSMLHDDKDLSTQMMKLPHGSREDGDYESDVSSGDSAQQRENNEIAAAMHSLIYSLPREQKWAIFRKQGISTVWAFPDIDYMSTAIKACVALEKKMRGNIATSRLWVNFPS